MGRERSRGGKREEERLRGRKGDRMVERENDDDDDNCHDPNSWNMDLDKWLTYWSCITQ